ncbi:hypothetical protein [Suicoccus acidiformans]|uniref:hypothetical protein n=1 Tax=Suicoccus acidiformans TaxID=2036206 RepID=UPI0013C30E7C|nr:hypothetical protein [Suicoccus acidiformans]
MTQLRSIFGSLPEDAIIRPPFHCDKGFQIHIGHNFYANTGLIMLDFDGITVGGLCLHGTTVSIYTVNHPIDAPLDDKAMRKLHPLPSGMTCG